MCYNVKGKCVVKLRLPGRGLYHVEVLADQKSLTDVEAAKENTPFLVALYAIHSHSLDPQVFPRSPNSSWGPQGILEQAGFKILYPKEVEIKAKQGVAKLKIRLPTAATFPTYFTLTRTFAGLSSEDTLEVNGCVYGEKKGDVAIFHVHTPEAGDYSFEMGFKVECEHYVEGASWLIISREASDRFFYFSPWYKLAGPNFNFHKLGFSSNVQSSTVPVENEAARLIVRKKQTTKLKAILSCYGHTKEDLYDNLIVFEEDDDVEIVVRPSHSGIYELTLYGCEEGEVEMVAAALYLVPFGIKI